MIAGAAAGRTAAFRGTVKIIAWTIVFKRYLHPCCNW
jgi:hypothetical protein